MKKGCYNLVVNLIVSRKCLYSWLAPLLFTSGGLGRTSSGETKDDKCDDDDDDGDEQVEEPEDYDAQGDNLEALRKQAQLPDLPDDGLPSASAGKVMYLVINSKNDQTVNCHYPISS